MTANSQIAHLEIWEKRNNGNKQEVIKDLCIIYFRIVKYVAGHIANGLPNYVEFDDLMAAGNLGLIQAIDNFDYTRGIKFETYATSRIRGNILDELRSQDWLPRSLRRKNKHLEKAQSILSTRLSRSANDDELAKHLDISLEELEKMKFSLHVEQMMSIDADISEGNSDDTTLADYIPAKGKNPLEIIIQQEKIVLIRLKILELSEKEQQVIMLYYYEELTLKEIGKILNVNESRICQIHTKVIAKLRRKISQKHLSINEVNFIRKYIRR